jgi:hypothetical protein
VNDNTLTFVLVGTCIFVIVFLFVLGLYLLSAITLMSLLALLACVPDPTPKP